MLSHRIPLGSRIASFLLFALIFLAFTRPSPASAQEISGDFLSDSSFDRSGEISGTVYTDSGRLPISEITITIRSMSLGTTRSVLPDFDGHFRVSGLARGTYQVIAEADGYSPTQTIAQVDRFPSDVSLHLKPTRAAFSADGSTVSVHTLKIPDKARQEYQRGVACLVKQNTADSIPHLKKATQLFPGYYEAYYHLGVAEVRLHHDTEAMENFQKAIDLSGGRFALAQFAYGLLLSDDGKPEEGERIIRTGLESSPDSPDGHFFLSIALYAQNRFDEAEKSVREALLRKPQLADAYLILSDIHGKRSDYSAQLQDLDTFLKLAPNGPQAERIRQIRTVVEHLAAQSAKAQPPSASNIAQ
jgi:Tfp pilus assembly protein PilF